jgi:hypothetical protein
MDMSLLGVGGRMLRFEYEAPSPPKNTLMYFKAWSLAGGAILEGSENFRRWT